MSHQACLFARMTPFSSPYTTENVKLQHFLCFFLTFNVKFDFFAKA